MPSFAGNAAKRWEALPHSPHHHDPQISALQIRGSLLLPASRERETASLLQRHGSRNLSLPSRTIRQPFGTLAGLVANPSLLSGKEDRPLMTKVKKHPQGLPSLPPFRLHDQSQAKECPQAPLLHSQCLKARLLHFQQAQGLHLHSQCLQALLHHLGQALLPA